MKIENIKKVENLVSDLKTLNGMKDALDKENGCMYIEGSTTHYIIKDCAYSALSSEDVEYINKTLHTIIDKNIERIKKEIESL
jgi:hypothetical protein